MIRNLLLLILVIVTFSSCNSRPRGVLNEGQMVDVLTDVHLTEYALRTAPRSINLTDKKQFITSVYTKHGITKEQFDASVQWYSQSPEEYTFIYEKVIVKLDTLLSHVENYYFHPQEIPTYLDSLDTIDLWDSETYFTYAYSNYKNKQQRQIDSLRDILYNDGIDTTQFSNGDIYRLCFRLRLYDEDSLSIYNTVFSVLRSDSVIDTVSTCVQPDSIMRIYMLSTIMPDSVKALNFDIQIIDSVNEETIIEIDSVILMKIFNFYERPAIKTSKYLKNEQNQLSIIRNSQLTVPRNQ